MVFGAQFGVSRQQVQKWESGKAMPQRSQLNKLVKLAIAARAVAAPLMVSHPEMLKQIATAADNVDALVNGKLDASDQRIPQSLPAPSSHLDLRPGKMRIQVHV